MRFIIYFLVAFANNSPNVLWPFDNNYADALGVYNGSDINSPTFISPGYAGYGSAVILDGTTMQYVTVTRSYHNLSYMSLTVEAWIYPRDLTSQQDYVLLNQCAAVAPGFCFLCMFRSSKIFMAFFFDDCEGKTRIAINQWHHVAYVYDYSTMTQRAYLNGYEECVHNSSGPYRGTSGIMNIGVAYSNYFWGWWNGYIDQLSIFHHAKSANEVLDDATLVAYFSFDNVGILQQDSGPLNLVGIMGSDISSRRVGRVNYSLLFSGTSSTSFFQITGLLRMGIQNYPFSVSLWLHPNSINSGTILHLSSDSQGTGWCSKYHKISKLFSKFLPSIQLL